MAKKQAIRAQLKRILDSRKFLASKGLSRFFRYVVEESLAGRAGDLKQYTIAVEGLGFDPGFDAAADPAVRIQARRLRRALSAYYETYGISDPIRIEIPKGTYAPAFKANERIRSHEEASDKVQSNRHRPGEVRAPTRPGGRIPIAIFFFENLTGDDTEAHLATGVTEEVLVRLTRFKRLLVIGPLWRKRFSDLSTHAAEMGQQLGTRFVLDGSVRKSVDSLRVVARLVDVASSGTVWAESYDQSLKEEDALKVQDDIAARVAAVVGGDSGIVADTIGREVRERETRGLQAYEAVLKVVHYNYTFTAESYAAAREAIEHAVKIAPDYALAHAMLACIYLDDYLFAFEQIENNLDEAERSAEKAVALSPELQEARSEKAQVLYLRGDREQTLLEFERAVELNPCNAYYLGLAGFHLALLGLWERGIGLVSDAMRLNPHYPSWYHMIFALDLLRQDECEAALSEAQRMEIPTLFWDPLLKASVLGHLGRPAEARSAVDQMLKLRPDFETRGSEIMSRLLFSDDNVQLLLGGLRKAGLSLEPTTAGPEY